MYYSDMEKELKKRIAFAFEKDPRSLKHFSPQTMNGTLAQMLLKGSFGRGFNPWGPDLFHSEP